MNDREVSKGIVVNPSRCSGTPVIRGTRTYAENIARQLEIGRSVEDVADDYALTLNDVVNVKYWVKRGMPR